MPYQRFQRFDFWQMNEANFSQSIGHLMFFLEQHLVRTYKNDIEDIS